MQETLLFICSLVACIIGILTFIVGMQSRSKNEGVLAQKLEQAIEGIEEIKKDLKSMASVQQQQALDIKSHEEKIKTLYHNADHQDQTNLALTQIADALKHLANKGDTE